MAKENVEESVEMVRVEKPMGLSPGQELKGSRVFKAPEDGGWVLESFREF